MSKVDVVFAGFPCQGFSNAGKKSANDPRNTMFREFARIVDIVKPKIVIGENVKGLMSRKTSNGENYIDVITKVFEDLGYDVISKVMKCRDYGIPQDRERLIILGVARGQKYRLKLFYFSCILYYPSDLETRTVSLLL